MSEANYWDSAKAEIVKWENEGPSWLANVGNFILWPAQKAAEALIPGGVQDAVAKAVEGVLLGLSNASQSTIDPSQIRARVAAKLSSYGAMRQAWQELEGADQEAHVCWNWGIGFAAAEGAATGALGLPGLAADIPAILGLAFRIIQEIATCYGYDITKPEEKEYVIHVLHTATAGDVKAKIEALLFLKQIEQILLNVSWKKMAADLAAKQIGQQSFLAAVRQFAKSLGINLTKRKALQMVPIIGAVVGGSFNASFAHDIGRAAFMNYRRRWIAEREAPAEDMAWRSG